ncbi:UNVERIFIED_CONTAM: MBL fold metallo-hydrolase [Microbacterium sp. SLM126]
MIELAPGVSLIGGGWLGVHLTHRLDSNVYLVGDERGAAVIDAGCGLDPSGIMDNLLATGVPASAVSFILLTHTHADHAGGAQALSQLLGADLLGSVETARILRDGDEDAAGLTGARRSGLYPDAVRIRPSIVSHLADGDRLQLGGTTLTAIETPGHAAGHLAYAAQFGPGGPCGVFTGDLVFSRGRVAVLSTPDTSVPQLARSIQRVYDLQPDHLFPGHGEPVIGHALEHLAAALDAFDDGRLPESLI